MEWFIAGGIALFIALLFYRRSVARTLDDLASARIRLALLHVQLEEAETVCGALSRQDATRQQSAQAHLETIRLRLESVQKLERLLVLRCTDRTSRLTARLLFLPTPDP